MDQNLFNFKWVKNRQRMSEEEFTRQTEAIDQETRESAIRALRIGNLQILHVIPEITPADLKFEFDTDYFMRFCDWARNDVHKYVSLKKLETGFYIFGKTGCGKTVFLKAKALSVGKKNSLFNSSHVKFVNLGKLVNDLSKDNWIFKNYILDELHRCTHLFIDDIGTESGTQWHEQVLTEILDNRLHKVTKDGEPKTTSFSSNKAPDQLPYHPRVIRRIQEMGPVIQVAALDPEKPQKYY